MLLWICIFRGQLQEAFPAKRRRTREETHEGVKVAQEWKTVVFCLNAFRIDRETGLGQGTG